MLIYTKKYKFFIKYNKNEGPYRIYDQSKLDVEKNYIPFGLLICIHKYSYGVWVFNHKEHGGFWSISKSLFDSEYILVEQTNTIQNQIHHLLLYKQIINRNKIVHFICDDIVKKKFSNIMNRLKKKTSYPDEIILNIFEYV